MSCRLQNGTTYNSFLIFGEEKTALVDASHEKFRELYIGTLKEQLKAAGRKIDYVFVSHTEPDHSGAFPIPPSEITTLRSIIIYIFLRRYSGTTHSMRKVVAPNLSGIHHPAMSAQWKFVVLLPKTTLHPAGLTPDIIDIYPEATVVGSKVALMYLKSLTHRPFEQKVVKGGDKVDLGGGHVIEFIMAPNLHWPDTIFSFDHATGRAIKS